MKKIFILYPAILFCFSALNLYSQHNIWEDISNQIPGDSTNKLSDVSGISRWTGFISSGSKPEIYRRAIFSDTWEVLQTPSPVTAFYIIDYDYGFMCGVDSSVYQTSDAGDNWNFFGSLRESINDIDYTNDFSWNGYICGDNGVIGIITDTGLVVIHSGINHNFSHISSPLKDKVWLLADSSIYFYDGSSFIKKYKSKVILNSIQFISEIQGWAVGDSGYIALTTDGGSSWIQKQNLDTLKRNLNDISLWGRYGWVVGDDGLILRTNDSGEKWFIETDWSPPNNLIRVQDRELGPALVIGENKTALLWPIVV